MKTKPPFYEDQELALKAKQGCLEARDRFAKRLRCVPVFIESRNRKLFRPLPPEDLEDIAQDVVAVVWNKISSYRGDAPLEGWIYQFCVFEMQNYIRRKTFQESRKMDIDDKSQELDGPSELREDFYEDIYAGLNKIETHLSQVVRLKHFSQLTFAEISEFLGVSLNTVKTRYYRGLLKLKAYLDPQRKDGRV